MNSVIEQDFSSKIRPQFDRFLAAQLNDHEVKVMPPRRYVPARIAATYDIDADVLAIEIFMPGVDTIPRSQSPQEYELDEHGLLKRVTLRPYLGSSVDDTRKRLNLILQTLKERGMSVLQYDVNRRTVEILKDITSTIRPKLQNIAT